MLFRSPGFNDELELVFHERTLRLRMKKSRYNEMGNGTVSTEETKLDNEQGGMTESRHYLFYNKGKHSRPLLPTLKRSRELGLLPNQEDDYESVRSSF